jgi:hypothetical protein
MHTAHSGPETFEYSNALSQLRHGIALREWSKVCWRKVHGRLYPVELTVLIKNTKSCL